jgi:hypothetical protein
MDKKEEFKKLMDEILNAASKDSKAEIPLTTKNVLHMLMNLHQQIEDQREQLNKLEERAIKTEEKFVLLIKELQKAGCINLGERRKLLKRNILTQEALINLLEKKWLIDKKELLEEIKRLSREQPSAK